MAFGDAWIRGSTGLRSLTAVVNLAGLRSFPVRFAGSFALPLLTKSQICELIPHREPFLWIDEVVEATETRLVARKRVDPDLALFRGHYPGKPILPGVILCEAAMQAGAVLIARLPDGQLGSSQVPVATRLNNVKFKHMVRPGDELELEVELTERLAQAYFLNGRVRANGKLAVQLEFAVTAAEMPQ